MFQLKFGVLLFMILCMIYCHIIDDYVLQDVLAKMKQKSWWKNQKEYSDKYKYDYIAALICHGFEWSFSVHIPIIIYHWHKSNFNFNLLCLTIIFNAFLHASIDNSKANMKTINLAEDQLYHLLQIIIIAVLHALI